MTTRNIIAICLVCLMVPVSLSAAPRADRAAARAAVKTVPTADAFVPRREPTGVMGWAAITDPSTGDRWLPRNYDYDPPAVRGYPQYIDVDFRNLSDDSIVTVSFRAGEGSTTVVAREAWKYRIDFHHVATMRGEPERQHLGKVRYNPALWMYAGVTLGPIKLADGGRVYFDAPLSQRSAPFADLPDP